jgi:hypothetical protein
MFWRRPLPPSLWGQKHHVPPDCCYFSATLHGIIFQKQNATGFVLHGHPIETCSYLLTHNLNRRNYMFHLFWNSYEEFRHIEFLSLLNLISVLTLHLQCRQCNKIKTTALLCVVICKDTVT